MSPRKVALSTRQLTFARFMGLFHVTGFVSAMPSIDRIGVGLPLAHSTFSHIQLATALVTSLPTSCSSLFTLSFRVRSHGKADRALSSRTTKLTVHRTVGCRDFDLGTTGTRGASEVSLSTARPRDRMRVRWARISRLRGTNPPPEP
eukprot:599853-Pyramimonas_sp.AAC.1